MKKILLSIIMVLAVATASFSQGDCMNTASSINNCGYFFADNNSTFGDCPGDGCVGGSTNPSNLDNDCSTTYPGGNYGSDFLGSIENSMFWKFRPTEDCDYELCISPTNCVGMGAGVAYMEVWIGQVDTTTGLITQYYVNDTNNTSVTTGNTVCYTFPVTMADGDVVMMVDGNAGTECDISLDINQVNCSDTCPVGPIMNVKWVSINGKNYQNTNVISWSVYQSNTRNYEVQRSSDGANFDAINYPHVKPDGFVIYEYTDKDPGNGLNYYRVKEVAKSGRISYSQITRVGTDFEIGKIINRYNLQGYAVDSTYNGVIIEEYTSGVLRKIVNNNDK